MITLVVYENRYVSRRKASIICEKTVQELAGLKLTLLITNKCLRPSLIRFCIVGEDHEGEVVDNKVDGISTPEKITVDVIGNAKRVFKQRPPFESSTFGV